jgi:hypothetical protein
METKMIFYVIISFIGLSLLMTAISTAVPVSFLSPERWLYRERPWEKEGRIYETLFKVRRWKTALPELSDFIKSVFPKKRINEFDSEYLDKYIVESCRSELTHWSIIFTSFFFRLWNTLRASSLIVLIAFILNTPYIIIQRYNRPRLKKTLAIIGHGQAAEPSKMQKEGRLNEQNINPVVGKHWAGT